MVARPVVLPVPSSAGFSARRGVRGDFGQEFFRWGTAAAALGREKLQQCERGGLRLPGARGGCQQRAEEDHRNRNAGHDRRTPYLPMLPEDSDFLSMLSVLPILSSPIFDM